MKVAAVLAFILIFLFVDCVSAQVRVRGYFRKDGTYVAPHYRSSPNSTRLDNYSTRGNVNPYTGRRGTVDPHPDPAIGYGGSAVPIPRAPTPTPSSSDATWWNDAKPVEAMPGDTPPYMSPEEGRQAIARLTARLKRDDPYYHVRYPILAQRMLAISATTPTFYWVREAERVYWEIPATKTSLVPNPHPDDAAASTDVGLPARPLSYGNALSPADMLAAGKVLGACSTLNSVAQFQKDTRLDGGDSFVVRFWESEAARLGTSPNELSTICEQLLRTYN